MNDPFFNNAADNPFGIVDPVFVDIDGDSDLDAFASGKFYQNTGTKTNPVFAAPITQAFGLPNSTFQQLTFSDIDGDGDVDAFSGTYEGNMIFYRNIGTVNQPAFAAAETNPFGLSNVDRYSTPTFVDIDNDGDLDMFSGAADHTVHFFKNTGTATNPIFAKPIDDPFNINSGKGGYSAVTFTDIDGDGDQDLFIQSDNFSLNGVEFFRNIGTTINPLFYRDTPTRFGISDSGNYVSVTFADIDGDNTVDAFVGSKFYENSGVSSNLPDFPTFIGSMGIDDDTLSWSPSTAFADIDGDGDMDAFIGLGYDGANPTTNGKILFYKNIGTKNEASFASGVTNPFGLKDIGKEANPEFVDIDGDQDLDAFVRNSDGNTLFFKNTETTTNPVFATPVTNPFGLKNVKFDSNVTFIDIDDDSDKDAFIINDGGNTLFFKNTGTPTNPVFATPVTNPFGLTPIKNNFSEITTFLDIDHDDDFDLISGSTILTNQGNATNPVFSPAVTLYGLNKGGYRLEPFGQRFLDIDGDGDLDIYSTFIYNYPSPRPLSTFFVNNTAPNVYNLTAPEQYSKGVSLNLKDIIVSDTDSASITVTLKLSNAAVGKLSTATSGAVTSTFNSATGIWTASGALASVNTLLADLKFIPANNGTDNFIVAATVSDGQSASLIGTKEFTIPGSSLLQATTGNDILTGTTGNDTVTYASATGPVTVSLNIATAQNTVSSGKDTLTGIDNLIGSKFNDKLTGDVDDNVIQGGAGNDVIRGWSGADTMSGGTGNDTYYVENAGDVVIEKANQGIDLVSSNLSYTLELHLENLTLTGSNAVDGVGNSVNNKLTGNAASNSLDGKEGADTLSSAGGDDFLSGDQGDDFLNGGQGNDFLNGGIGKDILTGGTGKDTFYIDSMDAFDTITDFNVADDTIQLRSDVFASLDFGELTNNQFRVGAKALDADDFIVYNKTTGAIFYDADGNGANAAIQIAKVGVGPALTNADFTALF